MQRTKIDVDQEVRQLAYRIWQEEGCPNGSDQQHWLKAQDIWRQTHPAKKARTRPSATKKPSKARTVTKAR